MKKDYGQGSRPARTPRDDATDGDLVAIKALGFLAADPERLDRFLNLSGLTAASLRHAAQAPNFTSAVLDYLMGDESLLLDFADHEGFAPETITRASQGLRRTAHRHSSGD